MPVGHLYIFFGKIIYLEILPILNWVVSFIAVELLEFFMYFEYLPLIGYINIIYKNFLPFSRLTVLLIVFLALQKLLHSNVVWFVYFHFCFLCLWSLFHINSTKMSVRLLPVFSDKNFMTSGFILKTRIYFELLFVCAAREWSSFIILHVAVWFPNTRKNSLLLFWRGYSLSTVYFCSCVINCPYMFVFIFSFMDASTEKYSADK